MAWIRFTLLLVALTTTLAYKRPYSSYGQQYQDQNYEQRVNDGLLELHSQHPSYDFLYPSGVNRQGSVRNGRNLFIPKVTKECERLGFCENSPDYPHEYVEALLAELPQLNLTFHVNKKTSEMPRQKYSGSDQTIKLCKTRDVPMYPDKVRTKSGKWVFAINGRKKLQGLDLVICLNEDEECSNIVSYPWGYKPTCVQKRMDTSMWALDHSGKMTTVTTAVPSCCNCELKTT